MCKYLVSSTKSVQLNDSCRNNFYNINSICQNELKEPVSFTGNGFAFFSHKYVYKSTDFVNLPVVNLYPVNMRLVSTP